MVSRNTDNGSGSYREFKSDTESEHSRNDEGMQTSPAPSVITPVPFAWLVPMAELENPVRRRRRRRTWGNSEDGSQSDVDLLRAMKQSFPSAGVSINGLIKNDSLDGRVCPVWKSQPNVPVAPQSPRSPTPLCFNYDGPAWPRKNPWKFVG